jgi:type III restriction enzyme
MKKGQPYFEDLSAEEVREGYFAKKQAKNQAEEFVDTAIEETKKTAAEKELEKAAYQLIMKSKERLLSFDEKVSFIFAHSALKEGWDNPNVFQICTLRQTMSEMRKRQEIGRGMRLAVDQNGERINGDDVNILTVIANES